MNKYKVCVYAICKNEEKFINTWYNSMSEADEIYVLDTGSTDNSLKLLENLGIHVKQEVISPWRFDVARNKSLEMVPSDADICVCTDFDEVFNEGWRSKLEEIWNKDLTRLRYNYIWSFDKYNNPSVNFYIEKIHARNNFTWVNPVHEILKCSNQEISITTDDITLNHYPDENKSRSSYLPLLELSVKEDPENDRNVHYLGREYMYYKKYNEAIDTLIKHLNLKNATWKDERSASMRYISRCYINQQRYNEAKMWLDMAIKETPYLREPYIEKAMLEQSLSNHEEVIINCNKALEINTINKTYINETFSRNDTIYDLLSVSFYYLNNKKQALKYINLAFDLNKNNKRLKKNKKLILKMEN